MAEIASDLINDQLEAIRSEIADLRTETVSIGNQVRVVKGHAAALVPADVFRDSDVAALKLRGDRIERRLDLTD